MNLDRPVLIDCCKDGTITYRRKGSPSFNGAALPVFSVDTEDEARYLQVLICKAQYNEHPLKPGETWYRLSDFSGEVEDLAEVTALLHKHYEPKR